MLFHIVPNDSSTPAEGRDVAYLWTDNWNDYWDFRTLYVLTFFDASGQKHEIGAVKIGQFDMRQGQDRPTLPDQFETLGDEFFSLGQDASYYAAIVALDAPARQQILDGLRDVVHNQDLYEKAKHERVMSVSLMRSISERTIEGQFRRILAGGVILTEYAFRYEGPVPKDNSPRISMEFRVEPASSPPTNIHVLVGRNGVGKTFLLNRMAQAIVGIDDPTHNGLFKTISYFLDTDEIPFSGLVSVTFSAFDNLTLLPEQSATSSLLCSNIGLRKRIKSSDEEWVTITRDPADLAEEFSVSARISSSGAKAPRWKQALSTLETAPLFADAEVASLADIKGSQFRDEAISIFNDLSSGHKIVLLTITKLVEKLEERTLVLMDEPEAHLHPPLLSAFVRTLSDLLTNRNGVAIIATHSPVVLQEVPASCVWKIVRHGGAAQADRPEIETFAENVGILTREIFGLEVTRSGFHRMIVEASEDSDSMEAILSKFDNEIGSEGRALISSILASRGKAR